MRVLQHKVVSSLPVPLQPNSIYYVRKGIGFDIHVTNDAGVVVAYSLNANLDLEGKVDKTDARLTDSREWSEATVTQAEAEAGTASTRRAWTAQRVRQAINAWWQLVTSGFGRNLVSATNEQAARNVLQLGIPATHSYGAAANTIAQGNDPRIVNASQNGHTHPWAQVTGAPTTATRWPTPAEVGLLNIGTTAATARAALELTGAWVDLRPYLKTGYSFSAARNGRNSYPRIRKLSCGRVELDGVVSFNATSGPITSGAFVRVPAEFRPPFTTSGVMFADTGNPSTFGACNWIALGQVEYAPPFVHGDIVLIPLALTSPAQDVGVSLNSIYWFT